MAETYVIFYLLLFVVALLYASAGHGGASGYLGLMAIYGFSQEVMRPTALILNILVSFAAFVHFYRSGYFNRAIIAPLILTSIPLAFVGGLIPLDDSFYRKLLGLVLVVTVFRFLFVSADILVRVERPPAYGLAISGGMIGLLSGMIGIGGGVLLAPLMLALRWADQKQTAATCALFIFVNSVAGLAGLVTSGVALAGDIWGHALVASAGGLLGAWLGANKFTNLVLKYVLNVLLLMAAAKLIFS